MNSDITDIRLTQTSAPAVEPISLSDAKTFLKVENTDDDTLITSLITAARQACENYIGRALITQSFSLFLDYWPGRYNLEWWDGLKEGTEVPKQLGYVDIPKPPLASITQVLLYAKDDSASVWNTSNYYIDKASVPGRIVLRDGASIPDPGRSVNGIEIQFTAGYGATSFDIPVVLIEGMKQMLGALYENRGDDLEKILQNSGAKMLWQPYRIVGLL